MELATDEIVLEKLESNEKKEYGMALINALETFQEEKYTAKLLCVTDDNKNIERRIKMLKLSDKFSKNKIIIAIISTIVILVGVCLFFTKKVDIEENNTQTVNNEITQKYEYKSFKPTFKTSPEIIGDDYDFSQDMINKDGIYYKKLNDYEEYSKVKSRWNDILDMTKSFQLEKSISGISSVIVNFLYIISFQSCGTNENWEFGFSDSFCSTFLYSSSLY